MKYIYMQEYIKYVYSYRPVPYFSETKFYKFKTNKIKFHKKMKKILKSSKISKLNQNKIQHYNNK